MCLSLLSLLPLLYSQVRGLCSSLLLLHGRKSIYSFCATDLLGKSVESLILYFLLQYHKTGASSILLVFRTPSEKLNSSNLVV